MSKQTQQQQVGAIQNQMNDFINMVLDRTSKTNFHTLVTSSKVTPDNYEVFGNLAYLLGIGFTTNEWNAESVTYILRRLKQFNISSTILKNFFKVISETEISKFMEGKDKMLDLINQPIEKDFSLKNKIVKVIESSLIPINITPTLSSRFIQNPDEQINFHDLIIFNNSFYQDFIVSSVTSKMFISLSKSKEYSEKLAEASLNFDMQKFAYIYIENINNVQAFLNDSRNYEKALEFASLLDKPNDNDLVKFIEKMNLMLPERSKIEESTVEGPVDETEVVEESPAVLSDPTVEIEKFLTEFQEALKEEGMNLDYKNNLENFQQLLESVLNPDNEALQSFYMYLKQIRKNQELLANPEYENNPDLESSIIKDNIIFNSENAKVKEFLVEKIKAYQEIYTNFANKYSSEISKEDEVLCKLVDEIILLIFVQSADDKSVLFSQIDTNSIFTYKHLHQTLLSIENQFIAGSNIKAYNIIYSKLKEEHKDVYDMFMNTNTINDYELKIKLTYAFKNIL